MVYATYRKKWATFEEQLKEIINHSVRRNGTGQLWSTVKIVDMMRYGQAWRLGTRTQTIHTSRVLPVREELKARIADPQVPGGDGKKRSGAAELGITGGTERLPYRGRSLYSACIPRRAAPSDHYTGWPWRPHRRASFWIIIKRARPRAAPRHAAGAAQSPGRCVAADCGSPWAAKCVCTRNGRRRSAAPKGLRGPGLA